MDNSLEKAFCMFCGSPFLVKDEIQRVQIQHTGTVTLSTSIEPMIKSAVGFIKLNKWDDANRL